MLALTACGAVTGSGNPNVAATVNGTEIPVSEVEERFEQAKKQPQVAQRLEAEAGYQKEIQAQILSQLVVSHLLQEWADDLSIEASPSEVADERDKLIESVGGQDAFDQAVEQSGLSEEDINEQIRQRVLQTKISTEVAGDGSVTDADIAAFYKQNQEARFGEKVTARHILVKQKAKADQIMGQLKKGGDFAKLAKENSTDPGSAEQGGELPEFGPGQMVPEFDRAVFAAEPGKLVGPVKTEFGYHIIEVLDKKPGQELADVREEIRAELAQTQSGELVQKELEKRTKEAEITVNPRFGKWNPETAQVEPEKPLGNTSEAPTDGSVLPTEGGTELPPVPTEAATQ
jgi:parvulin-like peptidyl-prolyl isomerase